MNKSKCCNATVKVISSDEGTSYYQCEKCGEGCDIAESIKEKTRLNLEYCLKCGWVDWFTTICPQCGHNESRLITQTQSHERQV